MTVLGCLLDELRFGRFGLAELWHAEKPARIHSDDLWRAECALTEACSLCGQCLMRKFILALSVLRACA